MKKKLNEDLIQNELKGNSVFFRRSEPPKAKQPEEPNHQATMPPRHQEETAQAHEEKADEDLLEAVRKAVKEFGKEAATHRFTREEKREIARLIYMYSTKGIRTNENEVTRIAVNYLVRDYKTNQEASILNQIIQLLND